MGDVLTGSSFTLNREMDRGGVFSFWSRGARSSFFGREENLGLDGTVRTAMLGTDYASVVQCTGGASTPSFAAEIVRPQGCDNAGA